MSLPPLTVVGGYLGAGKTTLVNRILAGAAGARIAVIVNDFGAINVDASLIRSRAEDTISLTNGCMCCTAADGTAAALARLVARGDEIDRIVIEASGVSEPGKIALNAHGFRLPLEAVIVLADAEQLHAQAFNRYVGDVVRRQLRQADLIVLNKTDLVDAEALAERRALIADLAPDRPVIAARDADLPLDLLFAADRSPAGAGPREVEAAGFHALPYRTWLVEPDHPVSRGELALIAAGLARRAIRAKGAVLVADDPATLYLYQQVGARWSLTPEAAWAGPPATRIVAIGLAEGRGG